MASVFLLELIIKEAIFHASNSYFRSYKSALVHIWVSGQGVMADVCHELKGTGWMPTAVLMTLLPPRQRY